MTTVSSHSSSSAESSFRELDDIFLQTQTRIWLQEVLHMRFDEELNIGDLLSDGELLLEVSKVLWSMLLVKFMELSYVKAHTRIPDGSRKCSGRYTPYSNVDSFLKVCKVMGLDGIDLFSPSDVVEKRDTRKVCICIRSLSNKARSKQLSVPDFDIVTNTIAMPTYTVECIRRSLELSKCRIAGSNHSQLKGMRLRFRQKCSVAAYERNNVSYFEESDEAKSSPVDTQTYSTFTDTSDSDALYQDTEKSLVVNSTVKMSALEESESSIADQERDSSEEDRNECPRDSISSPPCDYQMILYNKATHVNSGVEYMHEESALDFIDTNNGVGNETSCLRHLLGDTRPKVNHASHQLEISDPIAWGTETNDSLVIAVESLPTSSTSAESYGSNSTQSTSRFRVWRRIPASIDDGELSSSTSMSSMVGRLLSYDFDAKSDADDLTTINSINADLDCYKAESLDKGLVRCYEYQDVAKYERPLLDATIDADESQISMETESSIFSTESFLPYWDGWKSNTLGCLDIKSLNNQIGSPQRDSSGNALCARNTNFVVSDNDKGDVVRKDDSDICARMVYLYPEIDLPVDFSDNMIDKANKTPDDICNHLAVKASGRCNSSLQHQSIKFQDISGPCTLTPQIDISANRHESSAANHPFPAGTDSGDVGKVGDQACNSHSEDLVYCAEHKDEEKDKGVDNSSVEISDERNYEGTRNPHTKRTHIGPILKTVARGTALIGVLFLLHLRIKSDRKRRLNGQSSQIPKSNGVQLSSWKGGKEKRELGFIQQKGLSLGAK